MSRGVNKVILLGNLGNDPDIRSILGGTDQVATFSIATSETWKDKNTGENREKTEWHNLVAYGKTAEIVKRYCKKGSKIYVEGRLQTSKWQDKEGNDRYKTEVIVNDLRLLDSKNSNLGDGSSAYYDQGVNNSRNAQQSDLAKSNYGNNQKAPNKQQSQINNRDSYEDQGDNDEEIPF